MDLAAGGWICPCGRGRRIRQCCFGDAGHEDEWQRTVQLCAELYEVFATHVLEGELELKRQVVFEAVLRLSGGPLRPGALHRHATELFAGNQTRLRALFQRLGADDGLSGDERRRFEQLHEVSRPGTWGGRNLWALLFSLWLLELDGTVRLMEETIPAAHELFPDAPEAFEQFLTELGGFVYRRFPKRRLPLALHAARVVTRRAPGLFRPEDLLHFLWGLGNLARTPEQPYDPLPRLALATMGKDLGMADLARVLSRCARMTLDAENDRRDLLALVTAIYELKNHGLRSGFLTLVYLNDAGEHLPDTAPHPDELPLLEAILDKPRDLGGYRRFGQFLEAQGRSERAAKVRRFVRSQEASKRVSQVA